MEKIAQAFNLKISDFLDTENNAEDINSLDAYLMEKVKMIDAFDQEEKKTVFRIVDAFIGNKELKDALFSNVQNSNTTQMSGVAVLHSVFYKCKVGISFRISIIYDNPIFLIRSVE